MNLKKTVLKKERLLTVYGLMAQKCQSLFLFFSLIVFGGPEPFLHIFSSAAPQQTSYSEVPTQIAGHLMIDSPLQAREIAGFKPGTAGFSLVLLPVSHHYSLCEPPLLPSEPPVFPSEPPLLPSEPPLLPTKNLKVPSKYDLSCWSKRTFTNRTWDVVLKNVYVRCDSTSAKTVN